MRGYYTDDQIQTGDYLNDFYSIYVRITIIYEGLICSLQPRLPFSSKLQIHQPRRSCIGQRICYLGLPRGHSARHTLQFSPGRATESECVSAAVVRFNAQDVYLVVIYDGSQAMSNCQDGTLREFSSGTCYNVNLQHDTCQHMTLTAG